VFYGFESVPFQASTYATEVKQVLAPSGFRSSPLRFDLRTSSSGVEYFRWRTTFNICNLYLPLPSRTLHARSSTGFRFGFPAPQMRGSSSAGFRFRYETGNFLRLDSTVFIRRFQPFHPWAAHWLPRKPFGYPPERVILRTFPSGSVCFSFRAALINQGRWLTSGFPPAPEGACFNP
jgi:hypothetical protein